MNNYVSRVCPSCGSTLDLENDYVKPKFDASENYELAKERFVGFSEENVFLDIQGVSVDSCMRRNTFLWIS